MAALPEVLVAGPVLLRCWRPDMAGAMLVAVEESMPELEQWMPWAQEAPTLAGLREVLRSGESEFHADRSWEYAIVDAGSDEIIGSLGVHRTRDLDTFEIGYWVRTSRTRRGVATRAARTVIGAVSTGLASARTVVIRMDEANVASASVPPKLGFTLTATEAREIDAPGQTGRGLVWSLALPG